MDHPVLSNPRAERVKAVRALTGRSARSRHGRFLAEGPQAVREAVAAGAALELYTTAEAARRYPGIVDGAPKVWTVTDEVLAAMTDTVTPQGLLAVCPTATADLDDVLATHPRLVAVLDKVRDPGNAGTVLRAADAAGADAVVLTASSVDVFNPKCVRSTAGSLFHLPVVVGVPLEEVVTALQRSGSTVLAADGEGEHDLDDLADEAARGTAGHLDLRRRTAWVFGNEAAGLDEAGRSLADAVVRVPLHGRAESLNLATAAVVCLYASARAHRDPRPEPRRAGG
ncbi:TrmH family RNA methyltransferase [Kineococcus sp. SYSU DK003]|uniref:TrmH family RNA methyltransferase n=1 Tax=Kineococcus sp. SYSU DK003 TaxID=3383124 RepID=UPI003D7CD8FC